MVLTAMGRDPEDFDWGADRPGHDRRYAIDWYVESESWWRPAKEATEARYRAQGQ